MDHEFGRLFVISIADCSPHNFRFAASEEAIAEESQKWLGDGELHRPSATKTTKRISPRAAALASNTS